MPSETIQTWIGQNPALAPWAIGAAAISVKVQNWDKTISVTPTYNLVEVPFRNWRGMQESGGRRIKRAIYLDLTSVRFCDAATIDRLSKINLIKEPVADQQSQSERGGTTNSTGLENPVSAHQFTNLDALRAYVTEYLKSRPDLTFAHWPDHCNSAETF